MSPRRAKAVLDRVDEDPAAALRAHLIEVAERLVAERTIASITTRDVARAAGVSDGVLYNYFADKHDLLLAALVRRFEHLAARFEADLPLAGTATVEENLTRFCRAQVSFQSEIVPVVAGLLSEPALLGRFIEEIHSHPNGPPFGRRWTLDYLLGEQRLGRVSPSADPTAVTTLLMGAGLILAVAAHLGPAFLLPTTDLPEAEERIQDMVRTLMPGLVPSGPR